MQHPYHHQVDNKTFKHHLFDFGLPVALFLLFFYFYNFGKISPSEMVKTTGLLSISLLAITLLIGPLCKFFPVLDFLKAHRKMWGIFSFLTGLTHVVLIFIYFYKFNFARFFNTSSPKFLGTTSGLLALAILFLVTMTSNKLALTKFSPKTWKIIQTTSYLALILAVSHFFLMESTNGVLVIKRVLGQITFYFSALVVLVRLAVFFLPSKK